METRILPDACARRNYRAEVERWRDNLLDLETIVDDKRRALDFAVDELHVAVLERDRAAAHLTRLVAAAAASTPVPNEAAL